MNNTHRGLNRALLLVIGLVLLGVGALVSAIAFWPYAGEVWTDAVDTAREWAGQAATVTRIGETSASWFAIGLIAIALLGAALLVLIAVRLIPRRTGAVLRADARKTELGRITVTERFVADALGNALREREDVLACAISANDVKGAPVLHLGVTPRPGTDPRPILADVDRLLTNLASLTGARTRTYVSLHAGLRARLSSEKRRLD